MMHRTQTKRRLFPHVVVLFFLVLLLAGLAVLIWLWRSLESYEKTTPRSALAPVAQAVESRDYGGLATLCGVDMRRFFDPSQYSGWIEEQFGAPQGEPVIQESGARGEPGETGWEIVNGTGGKLEFFLSPKPGGGYTVRQPEIPVRGYTVFAPPDVTVTANGRPLAGQAGTIVPDVEEFSMMPEKLRPHMAGYRVEGFTKEPSFALLGYPADQYRIEPEENGSLAVTLRPSGEPARALREFAEQVARQYALYISTDVTFGELAPLLMPNTEFYKTLSHFRNDWYVEHQPPAFENLTVKNLEEYTPNHYTAEVAFDFHVVSNKKTTRVIPAHYRLAIYGENRASGFQLVNLELL